MWQTDRTKKKEYRRRTQGKTMYTLPEKSTDLRRHCRRRTLAQMQHNGKWFERVAFREKVEMNFHSLNVSFCNSILRIVHAGRLVYMISFTCHIVV